MTEDLTKRPIISPSILSADFAYLKDQITAAQEAGANRIHVDVMDGHFVPNLTMGPFIVATVRRITDLPIDVHLMVEKPETMIDAFAKAGANLMYVHVEGNPHIYRTLQRLHELGCLAGVVLNPGTPAWMVEAVLPVVDAVLVMTVNPGYSGQKFIPAVIPKIAQIRKMLVEAHSKAVIAVDGGISTETITEVRQAGAEMFIAASAIFKYPQGITAGLRALKAKLDLPVV